VFTDDLKLLMCWHCLIWICQNKRCQNNFACEVDNFYDSQIKGFYSTPLLLWYTFIPFIQRCIQHLLFPEHVYIYVHLCLRFWLYLF